MKNRKAYRVIENSSWYIVAPDNEENNTEHYTFSTKEMADDFCKQKNSEYYISDYALTPWK